MARLKNLLAQEFDIMDLGKLQYFIRIEVARSQKGIFISERKNIFDLRKEIGRLGYKPAWLPTESNHKLQAWIEDSVDK